MPVTIDQNEAGLRVRVEGECTVTAAAELKSRLLAGLASSQPLEIDLAEAAEIDVSLLQLLWAVAREGAGQGRVPVSNVSEAARRAALEAGFDGFPGYRDAGGSRG